MPVGAASPVVTGGASGFNESSSDGSAPAASSAAVDGAVAGAQGGAVSTLGGGGTAVAGAAGVVGVEQLVPVLEQLTTALQGLVAALSPAGTTPVEGGGPAAAPPLPDSDPPSGKEPDAHTHDHAGHDDAKKGAKQVGQRGPDGPADPALVKRWIKGDVKGLNGQLLDRLAQLGEQMGEKLEIVSGFRSHHEQEVLYQKYLDGTGNLAAKPGSSNHESGNAADVNVGGVSLADNPKAKRLAAELGLSFPVSGEAWHVELEG